MKLYITRHSKTKWNQEHRMQGQQDSPLLKEGIEDAKLLKKKIDSIPIDICYSSPIKRAKETSKILFDETKIVYDDCFKEMSFGDFEGLYVKDLLDKKEYIDLWNYPTPNTCLPNGETFQQVYHRVKKGMDMLYQKHPNDTVFLTIHGMLFVVLRGIISGLPIEQFASINQVIRGCSLSYVEYDGKEFTIHYLGDDSHLPKDNTIKSYVK